MLTTAYVPRRLRIRRKRDSCPPRHIRIFGTVRPWDADGLQAEQRARVLIDAQLPAAGWSVQNKSDLNLFAGPGVAVDYLVIAAGDGRADYLLHVDKRRSWSLRRSCRARR
jgi:hypothetical protein